MSAQVASHDHGAREVAEDTLKLRLVATGDWGADQDVVLTGMTVYQHEERGEERRIQRGLLGSGQLFEPSGER